MFQIINSDCIEYMQYEMEPDTIDLAMFSPPYDAGMEYEERLGEEKYRSFLSQLFGSLKKVLKDDGRFVCVVPFRCGVNYGDWSRVKAVMDEVENCDMNVRDMIVWDQSDVFGTAWGSFASASSPNFQYQSEFCIVGYNEKWGKESNGSNSITNEEFSHWTRDNIWEINTKSDSEHPATYPVELCERFIKILTYEKDTVLDPFIGVGNTAIACLKTDREVIGIDKEKKYIEEARKRLNSFSYTNQDNQKSLFEY